MPAKAPVKLHQYSWMRLKMSQAEKIVIADAPVALAGRGRRRPPWRAARAVGARPGRGSKMPRPSSSASSPAASAPTASTPVWARCATSRCKDEQLSQLSRNTLLSHACGVGAPLSRRADPRDHVRRDPSTTATANPACIARWSRRCWRCSTAASPRKCRPRARWVT